MAFLVTEDFSDPETFQKPLPAWQNGADLFNQVIEHVRFVVLDAKPLRLLKSKRERRRIRLISLEPIYLIPVFKVGSLKEQFDANTDIKRRFREFRANSLRFSEFESR